MKKNQLSYIVIVILLIITITFGILLLGIGGSLGGLADFDNDGIPNILDPDDDNDGVNDVDDYDPYDPSVTEEPTDDDDDDDDDDEPEEPSDWITIQLYIQSYDPGSPNTPGNPSYYILSVGGDEYDYYEWLFEGGVTDPPYEWEVIIHKQADGSSFDPRSMWGELSYDSTTDTWVDSSDPNYLNPIGSGTWDVGGPSPVWSGQIYIGGISGHFVGMDFYVWTPNWDSVWNYYVLFQVP